MEKKKILLIGSFSLDMKDNGGQPVKSRELYFALQNRYGENNVHVLETPGWKRHPIRLLLAYFKAASKHNVLIMLPSHNGVRVFSTLLLISKKIGTKKIFYSVIGGWLHDELQNKPRLRKRLSLFDGIWVETTSMKENLEDDGLNNVVIIPNFKKLKVLCKNEIKKEFQRPYPICTFSRVVKEKGIEDAINAVIEINSKGTIVYKLDIYGSVYPDYEKEFYDLMQSVPDYIRYKGMIATNSSVEVLNNYYLLLFPTHYYTEGIPGTLIDACSAGLPVIAPFWQNYKDVFEENITGLGYDFGNYRNFVSVLEKVASNPQIMNDMRTTAFEYSQKFSPQVAIEKICNCID